jgi:hypothetical protein
MTAVIRIDGLDPPGEVSRCDPQLHTLSCMFCDSGLKSLAAVARHLHREHPERSDFPVLFFGRVADPVGSAAMANLVLQEIDILLFNRLKMKSVQGRLVSAFKRVSISVVCPPGAFDSIVQSFDLRPRWTPSGMLIIDGATGQTIKRMIGPNCLERSFPTYKAVVADTDPVKMKWKAKVAKDHQNISRRETYYLVLSLICKSQVIQRAPRVMRSIK